MIIIEDATVAFNDKTVFSKLDAQITDGTFMCITGQSGGGKSTLLKALMGFVPLTQGRIIYDTRCLQPTTVDCIREDIAWIPQELSLPAEWVRQMIAIPLDLKRNKKTASYHEELLEAFAYLGIDAGLLDKRQNEISGGQRQRILLAVASLLHKKYLIADEPTSALDAASVKLVIAFFRRLQQQGTTIIVVSHDASLCAAADSRLTI